VKLQQRPQQLHANKSVAKDCSIRRACCLAKRNCHLPRVQNRVMSFDHGSRQAIPLCMATSVASISCHKGTRQCTQFEQCFPIPFFCSDRSAPATSLAFARAGDAARTKAVPGCSCYFLGAGKNHLHRFRLARCFSLRLVLAANTLLLAVRGGNVACSLI